jgi:nucleoside-diphosphate-sugar epimerase
MAAVDRVKGPLPPVVNVGSGRPTALSELADMVLSVVADPRLQLVVEPRRSFDVAKTCLDVGLAASALGWAPATSLADGIGAAWAAVRRLGDPEP